jgi:hypothetical protein
VDLMLIHGLDATTDVNAHVGTNYAFEALTQCLAVRVHRAGRHPQGAADLRGQHEARRTFDPRHPHRRVPGQFGLKIPIGWSWASP